MTEIVSRVPYMSSLEHAQVVSERVVAYSFDQFAGGCPRSTGSRSLRVPSSRCAGRYHDRIMSEHTEQLEDLRKRIASAKEFL